MPMVDFFELNESQVLANPNGLVPGSFICCKDSTNIYMVPTDGTNPVKMSETTKYMTETERANILAPVNGKKYFCYDTGRLWVYYNDWFCLNPSSKVEFDIEDVIVSNTGSATVSDSRITASSTGTFFPDMSVNDLISNIVVTCDNGSATITATCSYEIPGVLKIKTTQE